MLRTALIATLLLGLWQRAFAQEDNMAILVEVLKATDDPSAQADMLKGMVGALEGKKSVKMPAGWAELNAKLSKSPNAEVRQYAEKLSASFGDASTLQAIKTEALDKSLDADRRRRAFETLLAKQDPAMIPVLQETVADAVLREQSLKALSAFDDARTPGAILAAYGSFDVPAKRVAVNTLAGRLTYARELMKAVQQNKIARSDLTANAVRQLRNFNDKELDAWVLANWGVARTTPDEKLKEIERWKGILTDAALKKADPSAGRALFVKTCQQCHTLYGEGGKVGPDITGSNRSDVEYVLSNVIDPSAVIAKDYQVTNIWTKDGEVVSGIVTREDDAMLTVTTESGPTHIDRKEIKDLRKSELSMMPEGLLATLKQEEVFNLVAYLRTPAQVPLPK